LAKANVEFYICNKGKGIQEIIGSGGKRKGNSLILTQKGWASRENRFISKEECTHLLLSFKNGKRKGKKTHGKGLRWT